MFIRPYYHGHWLHTKVVSTKLKNQETIKSHKGTVRGHINLKNLMQ